MKRILTQLVARRWALTALGVVFGFSALLLWPTESNAQVGSIINFVKDPTTLIATILINIVGFLGKLLIQIINILIAVAQYNGFSDAEAIKRGWVILRDIGNIFFIIVLMVIAFATILKIENYRYNRLLGRLIIMAVLVNFSKMIAGLFIDFTQVIMLTFVSAFQNAAAGNLAQGLGLTELLNLRVTGSGAVTGGEIMTALILANVMLLISLVVVGVVTLVLIMRVLALWLLVVLSPIAYIARTFPLTERYSRLWWSNFGKYATSGPIMAFFLWLTFTIVATGNTTSQATGPYGFNHPDTTEVGQTIDSDSGSITSTISAVSDSDSILSFIIAISLLVGSLTVTSQLGVAGGQLAGAASERIRRLAGRGAVLMGAGAVAGPAGFAAALFGRQIGGAAKQVARAPAGLVSYGERKWYERGGPSLRPSRYREAFKETVARRRAALEDQGRLIAGTRLAEGGPKGFFGGLVGGSRDWFETYAQWKGVPRAFHTLRGTPGFREKLQKEKEEENEKLKQVRETLAKGVTKEDKEKAEKQKASHEANMAGLKGFTVDKGDSIDISKLTNEMKLKVTDRNVAQLASLQEAAKTKQEEAKNEKDPSKAQRLTVNANKLADEALNFESEFGNLIAIAKERKGLDSELISAQNRNDAAEEARIKQRIDLVDIDLESALPETMTLKPEWSFTNDWRTELTAEHDKMQGEMGGLEMKLSAPEKTPEFERSLQDEINKRSERVQQLTEQEHKYAPPEAFYALRDHRLLLRDISNKIDTSNDEELVEMMHKAITNNDSNLVEAIMLRAAKATHLNELPNGFQYTHDRPVTEAEKAEGYEPYKKGENFASTQQGLSDFVNQILIEKVGLSKERAYSTQNDASEIAQEYNQWTVAQSMGMKDGKFYQRSPNEQSERNIVQMGKHDQETLARRMTRLGLGGEYINPDTGEAEHRLAAFGVAQVKGSWPTFLLEITERGRFMPSMAKALANDYNTKILKELAKTFDNTIKKEWKGLKGEFTQREAFNRFIQINKDYAMRRQKDYKKEVEQSQEIIKRGTANPE